MKFLPILPSGGLSDYLARPYPHGIYVKRNEIECHRNMSRVEAENTAHSRTHHHFQEDMFRIRSGLLAFIEYRRIVLLIFSGNTSVHSPSLKNVPVVAIVSKLQSEILESANSYYSLLATQSHLCRDESLLACNEGIDR